MYMSFHYDLACMHGLLGSAPLVRNERIGTVDLRGSCSVFLFHVPRDTIHSLSFEVCTWQLPRRL